MSDRSESAADQQEHSQPWIWSVTGRRFQNLSRPSLAYYDKLIGSIAGDR